MLFEPLAKVICKTYVRFVILERLQNINIKHVPKGGLEPPPGVSQTGF